jgi:diguanylate cyclase (GGDEF)-like protein
VASIDGALHGVTLLLHDASPETSLEERCQALHEKAIRDPLTQLANRAEFDRVQGMFIEAHSQRALPCSLIICDIDHFKHVNDNWGHPAGDEVIRSFAQLLKVSCRSGDLVARYGGEEFVMLCADCNVATAFDRAETIRRSFAALPQPVTGGRMITASFGVTQTQPGDTSATLLNRADRALLSAKGAGRNLVVQLGAGGETAEKPKRHWWQLWQTALPDAILEQYLITAVPLKVTIEKLRGFVADQPANVETIEDSRICILIPGGQTTLGRRSADRATPLLMELSFAEEQVRGTNGSGNTAGTVTRTRIHVVVRPKRNRDRRRSGAVDRARRVLNSLRSYLMATEDDGPVNNNENVLRRATHMLVPWLLNKDDRR